MKDIKKNKRLTVIDFFCGAGGFSEGFRRAGFDVVMGVDYWQPAITTHNFNHNLNDNIKSVLDFENVDEIEKLPDTDIIIGSPPCQLFSVSNNGGNADKTEGVRLINTFLKVIAVKKFKKNSKLKAWLMENVPNSRNFVKEHYTFSDLGLKEWAKSQGIKPNKVALKVQKNGDILQSDDYGSAQTRKRFVCGEMVTTGQFPHPEKISNKPITLEEVFKGFPKPFENIKLADSYADPNYPEINIPTKEIFDHFYDTGVYQVQWQKARDAKQKHPYMGKMSFPENVKKPSRTIMATQSASTREAILYKSELNRKGDGEYRLPTIREAAIIMGFPIDYQFFGSESIKWRQVGNAVCVQVSYALAIAVLKSLELKQLPAKTIIKNVSELTYLDNAEPKQFDNPPVRNEKALFRQFPIKSGNMTVDLTNKIEGQIGNWGVIAHSGTGKEFKTITVSRSNQIVAKRLLRKLKPELIEEVKSDPLMRKYSVTHLNSKNKSYGFNDNDMAHPYTLVNYIGDLINIYIGNNDKIIDVSGTVLSELKEKIPLSQIMSLYLVAIIIYGK